MTTPKPALPEPVPPNAEGSTTCIVRWMVTTRDGLWLGAWDKEAFAAYTQFAIDAAVAEARAVPADWADQVEQRLLTWRQRMMNRSGDRLALDDFMGQDSIDDLIDFVCAPLAATPSPAEQPVAAHKTQSMSDNAACGSEVSDKEQPKPAVRTHGDGNAR